MTPFQKMTRTTDPADAVRQAEKKLRSLGWSDDRIAGFLHAFAIFGGGRASAPAWVRDSSTHLVLSGFALDDATTEAVNAWVTYRSKPPEKTHPAVAEGFGAGL